MSFLLTHIKGPLVDPEKGTATKPFYDYLLGLEDILALAGLQAETVYADCVSQSDIDSGTISSTAETLIGVSIADAPVQDATTTQLGVIRLANDLTGTALNPSITTAAVASRLDALGGITGTYC